LSTALLKLYGDDVRLVLLVSFLVPANAVGANEPISLVDSVSEDDDENEEEDSNYNSEEDEDEDEDEEEDEDDMGFAAVWGRPLL